MKRYVVEAGSDLVRRAMGEAGEWFMCRVGYVETARALGLTGGNPAVRAFRDEWPAFGIVAVDQDLVEDAAALARNHDLRSLEALHLAAAVLTSAEDSILATWDRRLHAAALREGLSVLPEDSPTAPGGKASGPVD